MHATTAVARKEQGGRRVVLVAAAAFSAVALFAAQAALSAGSPVVKVAKISGFGSVLTTASGRTLYDLSVERHGRFICTSKSCLSLWHPLIATSAPRGVAGLGLVTRPDRRRQVAFHGAPLYTFAGDTKPGQTKGNGFKDVGTWRVATVSSQAATSTPPSGGGYGGGSYR
jgi:predicted lipoprotein with Yx(FWY)xxD motif